ncbi:MAG: Kua-ubiquitin conjugating enzyme hybrid localization domain protein [Acidobacteriales bacterium]|nr:Kua-ubiquitin conjugating enzyme hybrid localization domain protein [Terriglobales bacterium]
MDSSLTVAEASAPTHDEMSILVQTIEALSILTACALILANAIHFARVQTLHWTTPLAILLALPAADFVSGLVHWTADTWGSEQWPVIGRRFLRPFRVHHINPHDFLRRNFVDTNGDVAMGCIPLLLAALLIPLNTVSGRFLAVFIAAFCLVSLPTNQIHQWSHRPKPPKLVHILQASRLILGSQHHQIHHTAPHVTNYCIISGWCNPLLAYTDFFRRLERMITLLTGLQPRAEEQPIEAS